MGYHFTAQWVKGAVNGIADTLSRYPTSDPAPQEMLAEQDSDEVETSIAAIRAVVSSPHESLRLQDLRKHTEEDHTYQQLLHYIRDGFPDHRSQLPDECWRVRDQLSVDDVYGCRLVIPSSMRKQVPCIPSRTHSHEAEGSADCVLARHEQRDRQSYLGMQDVSGQFAIPPTRANYPETQAHPPIPGDSSGLLFLCRAQLFGVGGHLHRLG